MRKLLWVLILISNVTYAQKQNNHWYFGWGAGVDFNNEFPSVLTNSSMFQVEGSASISDTIGNLLFYTDGISIWNANHVQMPNGFGLLGHSSSSQSALIVPNPSNCSEYYIFTTPSQDFITPLSYSVIDMNLDAGFGDVVMKNIPLHAPVNERLIGTLDSDSTGYWIIAQEHGTNSILSYHLSSTGLNIQPIISTFSSLADTVNSVQTCLGYMNISKNSKKLCYTFLYYNNTSVLLDFDNSNGTTSHPIILQHSSGGYGVEFSPDNSKLYISTNNSPFVIWQYDMVAGNDNEIQTSAIVIDSLVGPNYGGALQLASDNSIYVNRLQKGYLGAITEPNLRGVLCGYIDSAFYLGGKICQNGLPNFIKQYTSCSIGTGLSFEISTGTYEVVPNPFNDIATISYINQGGENFTLSVYDLSGRMVCEMFNIITDKITLHGQYLPSGVYYFVLANNRKIIRGKFIKE